MRTFLMVWGFILSFTIAPAPFAYSLQKAETEMARIRKSEPAFSEIAQEAFRREKLDLGQIQEWKKKMKAAPWLPTLYAGYDRALRKTSGISISDNVSVSTSGVAVGPDETDQDETLFNGDTLRFRAVWQLDEVVFHRSTLAASQEARDISKSRLALSDYLFKIYSERREAQAKYYLFKGSGGAKSLLLREKIEALTDQLDLFTEGRFSDRWRRE
ncbi:MAG: hypothetical protein HYU99_00190 [Deltaproteobacteria bacterium]|nr:hypothetical protein [Deltaproteobacteria bacterium]